MYLILIDTCVYVHCAMISAPGHDSHLVSALERALDEKDACLLVPEVVELELKKLRTKLLDQFQTKMSTIKGHLAKEAFPTYFADEQKKLLGQLDEAWS